MASNDKKRTGRGTASRRTAQPVPPVVPAEDTAEMQYDSPYRLAQRQYGADLDGLWEYLTKHRDDDPTLNLGYHLMRTDRERGWNQSDVAGRTEVVQGGRVTEKALTRGYISALLSGRSQAQPETLARVYRAMGANPAEYYRCKGWLDDAEIAAAVSPLVELAMPLLRKLAAAPREMQPSLLAVLDASIDTLLMARDRTNKPPSA